MSRDLPRELARFLVPEGREDLEVLVYSIRMRGSQKPAVDLGGWDPKAKAKVHVLADDDWLVAIELVTITSREPADFARAIERSCAALIDADRPLAWAMLDGAFGGIEPIFDAWTADNTYAVATDGGTDFALRATERRDTGWLRKLERAEAIARSRLGSFVRS
jgi:hypothetical protein